MKIEHKGNYLNLNELPNGNLKLTLTADGKEFLESDIFDMDAWQNEGELHFNTRTHSLLLAMLEDIGCNSEIELLHPDTSDYLKIGALTSAPIIAADVERNNEGELLSVGKVFWFPNYAIESELETLLTKGFVEFEGVN